MGWHAGASDSGADDVSKPCGLVLLVTWLCCCMWYEDGSEKNSDRGRSRADAIHDDGRGARRRSSEVFGRPRRLNSSAVSLHLPTTSGHKKPLSAHRSHEEIGRHKSQEDARYHSAPSVIDEVLHRRDWERSSRELHVPLNPLLKANSPESPAQPPRAEPESSSIEFKSEEHLPRPCKKHHSNIKSSKGRNDLQLQPLQLKEQQNEDVKDTDDKTDFYIGDSNDISVLKTTDAKTFSDEGGANGEQAESDEGATVLTENEFVTEAKAERVNRPTYNAKEAKQSLNESIRAKERPRQTLEPLQENHVRLFNFCLNEVIDQLETLDRSGAVHHSMESRSSGVTSVYPPPSVEAVGYEGGSCYLSEGGSLSPVGGSGEGRARHASDGDILAPPPHCRPESGAFSESDLDVEVEGADECPPPYEELQQYPSPQPERKETAI